jgi:hypothetical protein
MPEVVPRPLQRSRSTVTRAQALRGLPRRLAGRPDPALLGEELWALVSSRRIDAELDRNVLLNRTVRPFDDPDRIPPGTDLGVFECYRHAEVRERVSALTRPGCVMPFGGWVVVPQLRLVRRGLVGMHRAPAPSVRDAVRARMRTGRIRHVPAIVHVRDRAEPVYAHLMLELIGGRLRLAGECGLDDVPILVSRALFERRIFQDVLRISGLGEREFVVQDREPLRTDTAYLFDTSPYVPESVEYVQRILRIPDADSRSAGRLFLDRPSGLQSGRVVTNMDAVEGVCRRFGFEVRTTDDLSLDAQIELFANTRVVAAVHGSGLFNMAFRKGAPLTVLEIFPPGAAMTTPRPWWFFEAKVLGHEYELMACKPEPGGPSGKAAYQRDFAIDPEQLATTLAAVVDRV